MRYIAVVGDNYLAHHGILGQKWGRRRFQNPDKSLTPEGRERYGQASRKKQAKEYQKHLRKVDRELQRTTIYGNLLAYKRNKSGIEAYKASKMNNKNAEQKHIEEAKRLSKATDLIQNHQNTLIKDMEDTVRELHKNGYSFKVNQTNFNQPIGYGDVKKILKDSGSYKVGDLSMFKVTFQGYHGGNASTGNRITVRDSKSLSEKKRLDYATKWESQSYRPQIVIRN